ncbi:MAG TPA: ribosomal protein S18-alanine N-acetyltransferase [Candidatus Atribacteria bacterium]|nr:ribosomal protein S18-alanine N-acetyltransferase [Candidatus Atribacteria bacterium]
MAQKSGDREAYLWEEGDFKISRMRPCHLPQVVAIERSSFPQPWSYSLFLSELSNRAATYWVAFFQNKVIGYLGLWMVWGEGHITTFAIHPAYRGKGFGKKLFSYVLDYARNEGCREVLLEVRPSNVKAQNLYRKFGFQVIGVRKHYYADGEDALVMKKVF